MGNSPDADFKVRYNTAFADLWGILVRDASTGSVTDNLLHDSCSGLVFLNTGTTTGVHNWRVSNNIVTHNDKFCSAEADGAAVFANRRGYPDRRRRPHRASCEQGALEPAGW